MNTLFVKLIPAAMAVAVAIPAGAADAGLLGLLTPGTSIVGGIHVDRSVNSPFGQYLQSQMEAHGHGLDEFVALTGVDPRRDLKEVVAGGRHTGKSPGGLATARGNFDVSRILQQAASHGASLTQYREVDILAGPSEKSPWLAFLNGSIAVAGEPGEVRAAIDRWRAGSPLDPVMAAKAAEVSSRNDVWMISLGSPALLAGRVPDANLSGAMQGDIIQAIEQVSGGVKFGPEVVISGEALTRSDRDATALADVIRFFASLAQLSASVEVAEKMRRVFETMELTTSSNQVSFSVSIPEEQVEDFLRLLPRKAHSHREAAVP